MATTDAKDPVEESRLVPVVVVATVVAGVGVFVVPPTPAAMLGWALVSCLAVFVTMAITYVIIP